MSHWDETYAFSSTVDRPMENGGEWYAAVWCTGTVLCYKGNGWSHYQKDLSLLDRIFNIRVDDLGENVPLADLAEDFALILDEPLNGLDKQGLLRFGSCCWS